MIQLLLLLGIIFFTMLAVRRYLRTAPADAARKIRRMLLLGALLLALALVASGRLAFLVPLIGALVVSLVRLLPLLLPLLIRAIPIWQQRQRNAHADPAGDGADISTVKSRFLRMRLDHTSGEIGGEVLAGRYAGRQLAELNRAQLADLYAECVRSDQESATLLRAYLERVYGEEAWEKAGDTSEPPPPSSGKMTAAEAYEVLGLAKGASRDDIIGAHRRLMQRLHPDRGGSDYLAAKINQAKDVLLK